MSARVTLVTGLLRLLSWLPLPVVHGLGALLGGLFSLLPSHERRISEQNLRYCFPELTDRQRRRLLRRSLIETGKTMLELAPLWLWDGHKALGLIREVHGEQDWQAALQQGRGGIAITPHLGAWELAGLYASAYYPITTLYRPSRHGLDDLIRQGRERLGARTVPTDARGVRALYKSLRAGQVLGILPDQDPDGDAGIFVPFFGLPTYTMVLLSRLAISAKAPVFMIYAERLSFGRGYRLHFIALPEQVSQEPLEASVTAVNQAVEQAIRRRPEQYLWSYKRFKSRPPGAPRRYARVKKPKRLKPD